MVDNTSLSLLGRIQSGDQSEGWRQFSAVYEPLLENWLRRRGVVGAIADDIRQDVLLVVSQELGRFQHNGRVGAFRAWMKQILANRLRTAARRWKREQEHRSVEIYDLAEQLADDQSPLSLLWDQEHDQLLLQQLLELISPRFETRTMQAFHRVVLRGEDQTRVAEDLGMTVNALRIAQSRVLQALREVGEGIVDRT